VCSSYDLCLALCRSRVWLSICFCFFFQAEDGIRDFHVTGVQTCALPIFLEAQRQLVEAGTEVHLIDLREHPLPLCDASAAYNDRSEERRVGKECRSRWSADH